MKLQQPLDYAENHDQLEELKSVTFHFENLEDNEHPEINIIDIQEDNYMNFE